MAKNAAKKSLSAKEKAERVQRALANEGPLEFVFKLDGRLRDMSVFELIPTLQSMAVALEANRTLFPEAPDLRVGVKPIEEGSYEIHYVLSYAQEHLPMIAMAAPGGLSQIAQMLGDLGVIKSAGAGVLEVINRLRGKPKKIEEIAPNQFKAESENGAAVINGNVILQNPIIIENLNITIAAPTTKAEVTDVQTYLAAEPVETAVTTTKQIAGAIQQYVKELNKPGDEIKENVTTVWVNPHRGPFSGDRGHGGSPAVGGSHSRPRSKMRAFWKATDTESRA